MAIITKTSLSFNKTLMLAGLLALSACGGQSKSKPALVAKQEPHKAPVEEVEEVEATEETDQGYYRVELQPINSNISGDATGVFSISVEGDDLMVEGEMRGVHAGIKHYQAIHAASSCPDENKDENFDGVIDAREAASAYGPTLLPLDSILHAQLEGMSFGPIANEENYYFYRRSTTYTQLMTDLTAIDHDTEDSLIKLPEGELLNLQDRVMVVFGISSSTDIPSSVVAEDAVSVFATFPIACGRIIKEE